MALAMTVVLAAAWDCLFESEIDAMFFREHLISIRFPRLARRTACNLYLLRWSRQGVTNKVLEVQPKDCLIVSEYKERTHANAAHGIASND